MFLKIRSVFLRSTIKVYPGTDVYTLETEHAAYVYFDNAKNSGYVY
jgi:hypothetical protein